MDRDDPQSIGLSPERLKRLRDMLQGRIDSGEIPGAVVLIARRGRIGFLEPFGFRDREAGAAITHDAIFRIGSMTKPIISLAAMMLVEEGRLSLGAPVSQYLPELANLNVAIATSGGGLDLVPPAVRSRCSISFATPRD